MSNKQQLLKEFNLFLIECEMMGHSLLVNDAEYLQGDDIFLVWDKYKDNIKSITYMENECILCLNNNKYIIIEV